MIKNIWNKWRRATHTDKEIAQQFDDVCTTGGVHNLLMELESANQKIAELEIKKSEALACIEWTKEGYKEYLESEYEGQLGDAEIALKEMKSKNAELEKERDERESALRFISCSSSFEEFKERANNVNYPDCLKVHDLEQQAKCIDSLVDKLMFYEFDNQNFISVDNLLAEFQKLSNQAKTLKYKNEVF
jgi:hypothetical protein